MTLEEALKAMESKKVTHKTADPQGAWVTKCNCGYLHTSEGETCTEESFLEGIASVRKSHPEWNLDNNWEIIKDE